MKKTLITLAIASSLVASGAVYADSKFYGHAQVEVGSWGGDTDGMSVEDRSRGRIGFKASEDLGDGMKAIAKFEFKVDTADGDAATAGCSVSGAVEATPGTPVTCSGSGGISLSKREMMVGLKTGMGQVELGRLKSAYKYYGGVKYDPFTAGMLEARGNGGMTGGALGHNSFISDSFGYEHGVGAIKFRLTYDLDDGGPVSSPATANGPNTMTIAFKFATKKFEAGVALVDEGGDAAAGTSYTSTKVFGQVKFGKAGKLSIQIESAEDEAAGGTGDETDITYLDYQFPINKNNILDVAFATGTTTAAGVDDADIDFLRIAVTHKFSKSTKAWVGFRSTETTSLPAGTAFEESVVALGMQKRF